ncbi:hypothetical protein BDP81DRAFT_389139 [Colletotrichum phormii]|uniref:Uncharacterized protein n=1 Tax=Colletotrichum phormii TaxID=359342 RepID=A0AAJ0A4H8_9PEZI|nr:uncharacterized protein BDP81DRAFT_389139 [Colletotrichum phormii]KAK1656349.1 hypothetical protein BDP81DRAFT_389139 [Colletotrichum phormii]
MTIEQQRDVLDKTYRMLTDFCGGKPPRGSVAPWWETSAEGARLLLDYGIDYDHSMAHHDCQAYFLNTGESWTKIDYSQKAETWMKPLVRGKDTGLVEIPSNWYIDDLPPMIFIKSAPNSHGFVNARDVEDIWRDHFDYFYRELIEHFKSHEGVELVTMAEMADEFRLKNTPAPGALMPAAPGLMLRK